MTTSGVNYLSSSLTSSSCGAVASHTSSVIQAQQTLVVPPQTSALSQRLGVDPAKLMVTHKKGDKLEKYVLGDAVKIESQVKRQFIDCIHIKSLKTTKKTINFFVTFMKHEFAKGCKDLNAFSGPQHVREAKNKIIEIWMQRFNSFLNCNVKVAGKPNSLKNFQVLEKADINETEIIEFIDCDINPSLLSMYESVLEERANNGVIFFKRDIKDSEAKLKEELKEVVLNQQWILEALNVADSLTRKMFTPNVIIPSKEFDQLTRNQVMKIKSLKITIRSLKGFTCFLKRKIDQYGTAMPSLPEENRDGTKLFIQEMSKQLTLFLNLRVSTPNHPSPIQLFTLLSQVNLNLDLEIEITNFEISCRLLYQYKLSLDERHGELIDIVQNRKWYKETPELKNFQTPVAKLKPQIDQHELSHQHIKNTELSNFKTGMGDIGTLNAVETDQHEVIDLTKDGKSSKVHDVDVDLDDDIRLSLVEGHNNVEVSSLDVPRAKKQKIDSTEKEKQMCIQ